MKKKIVFLTGTRADFGKIKSLIEALHQCNDFEVHLFATGMHMETKYGYTVREIEKCGYPNIYKFINQGGEHLMDVTLARTIEGFSKYARLIQPDLIVVHGDRVETLAGATVGALNNILVAHIEGGEVSGTVDELIRHAVTKLSHAHLVSNEEAAKRIYQMGEEESSVFVIGSPDMDVMLKQALPSIQEVKSYYNIPFDEYAVSMFHPVTTEYNQMDVYAENYFSALEQTNDKIVAIYPNNDNGSDFILNKLLRYENHPNFKIFPSVRFESFLVLLKYAKYVVGNSSAGIRETPLYGIPTVNVGTRQLGRTNNPDIIHADYSEASILSAIHRAKSLKLQPKQLFGGGNSAEQFVQLISQQSFWKIAQQKKFRQI